MRYYPLDMVTKTALYILCHLSAACRLANYFLQLLWICHLPLLVWSPHLPVGGLTTVLRTSGRCSTLTLDPADFALPSYLGHGEVALAKQSEQQHLLQGPALKECSAVTFLTALSGDLTAMGCAFLSNTDTVSDLNTAETTQGCSVQNPVDSFNLSPYIPGSS